MISNLYATTLAQMYQCSLENDMDQYKILSEHLNDLNFDFGIESEMLRQAVICASMENFKSNVIAPKKSMTNEYSDVHSWVRRNMAKIVNMDVIDKFPSLCSGRRPDFLVVDCGKKYPVECKKKFNKKSLNQLEQYMTEMSVDRGYAVAFSLETELPDNIIFIKVDNG